MFAVNRELKMLVQAYKNVESNFSLPIHLPDREREGRAWMLNSENVKELVGGKLTVEAFPTAVMRAGLARVKRNTAPRDSFGDRTVTNYDIEQFCRMLKEPSSVTN